MQLILCGTWSEIGDLAILSAPIEIPTLTERSVELPRIIDEYGRDACATLAEPPEVFTADDHAWVLACATTSLAAIEKATLRRMALRTSTNVAQAAARLEMAPVSLARWMTRRWMMRSKSDSSAG